MNISTNPFFTGETCAICHVILKDTDNTHSIFSTLEELEMEFPMNVMEVLQSFSNFIFYNGPQMVCTTCYCKTIEVYKFVQMCNKAHEMDVDVKVEEVSFASTSILIERREFREEMENEKMGKFDELGIIISDTKIIREEIILNEGEQKEDTSNNEEFTMSHTEIVTAEKNDSIDFGKVFTTTSGFNTHIQMRTDEKPSPSHTGSHNEVKLKAHKCEQCNRRFTRAAQLRSHMDSHNGVKSHKCEQCDRQFNRATHLRRHMHSHNGAKEHKCEQCDRLFTRAENLRMHMDIHKGVKAHQCEQCGRRFSQAANLRSHMDSHNGVKSHKCQQCDRQFSRAAHLRRHMHSHNGAKEHKCEQCDRLFTRAENLRTHMDVHKGVKAHQCEQCDRRFTRAAQLRSHMDSHNGVKSHKCEQCNRQFSRAAHLRRHMHSHNGAKEHKCEQCDRLFTRAENLRTHMDIHKGVKAHQCEQCGRRFSQATHLRTHMDKMHRSSAGKDT